MVRLHRFSLAFLAAALIQPVWAQPSLTPHPNNPVVAYGPSGSWDAGLVFLPEVVYKDSLFHLFYTGTPNLMSTPTALGYATSVDGVTWTKSPVNPVFQADGTGFDAFMVAEAAVLVENNTWHLYYNARAVPGPGPGPSIGRATAASPNGPWTRLPNPVLQAGSAGEWDAAFVTPNAVIRTGGGYVLYYSGGTAFPFPPSDHAMVGMATSPDGITWTKYDDPTTTAPPYAESDPVLKLGAPGSYDSGLAWECDVLPTANGWEMFYTGDPDSWTGERICYATSTDGIHWVKDSLRNPILGPTQSWATLDLVDPSVVRIDSSYFVFYAGTTTLFDGQVGLATGTVTGVKDIDADGRFLSFRLDQNYPNPFNPSTTIRFALPRRTTVTLKIFDLLGREVSTLVDKELPAGSYEIPFAAGELASGVYFYRLKAGDHLQARKMVVLK